MNLVQQKLLGKLNNPCFRLLGVDSYFCRRFMRRVISILFLSLMLLQAIPVLHFFSSQKAVFYTYVDEEKPEQKIKSTGKEDLNKEALATSYLLTEEENAPVFFPFIERQPSAPLLEFLTPPPDAC